MCKLLFFEPTVGQERSQDAVIPMIRNDLSAELQDQECDDLQIVPKHSEVRPYDVGLPSWVADSKTPYRGPCSLSLEEFGVQAALSIVWLSQGANARKGTKILQLAEESLRHWSGFLVLPLLALREILA